VNGLIALGAMFDRDEQGRLELAREGGHSMARVVHAGGAATGAEIERALVDAVRLTAAALHENTFACGLVIEGGRCRGVIALGPDGVRREVRADHVLLATGGAGQMFAVTTNPLEATGDGIAMALRAGVAVADVEFVQFHPTALHHPRMPRPLLSEALRGHGALLRDINGERFVDELLPRDAVSRAMTRRMLDLGVDHCWLDATGLEHFDSRFPTIAEALGDAGLDPATDWLPIAPAAHYLCGGVLADLDGATSLPHLWAAGEVSCSGVHGANRLASNSLLEGMVFGFRVIEAIDRGKEAPEPTGAMRALLGATPDAPVIGGRVTSDWAVPGWPVSDRAVALDAPLPAPDGGAAAGPGAVDAPTADPATADARSSLQRAMTTGAGVLRSSASLAETAEVVGALGHQLDDGRDDRASWEVRNLVDVSRAVLAAATEREESRGAHTRTDFEAADDRLRLRLVVTASA